MHEVDILGLLCDTARRAQKAGILELEEAEAVSQAVRGARQRIAQIHQEQQELLEKEAQKKEAEEVEAKKQITEGPTKEPVSKQKKKA